MAMLKPVRRHRSRNGPNLVPRWVTAVFSDGYHTLHLAIVKTHVRHGHDDEGMPIVAVDRPVVERAARKKYPTWDDRDLVGILAAVEDIEFGGAVVWAREVEPTDPATIVKL